LNAPGGRGIGDIYDYPDLYGCGSYESILIERGYLDYD
jgi:hypothetical protein